MRLLRLLLLVAFATVLGAAAFKENPRALTDPLAALALELVKPAAKTIQEATTLVVSEGANGGEIAAQLAKEGLIQNPTLFRLLLAYYEIDRDIKAGRYRFPSGTNLQGVLDALKSGQLDAVTITIPEGWRAEQIADLLEAKGVAQRQEYLALVHGDPMKLSQAVLKSPATALEGYLFPETYHVPKEYGAEAFLRLQLQTFQDQFVGRFEAARSRTPPSQRLSALTVHQVVTLAAIVEREARLPEERNRIAGVYFRRLDLEMPLAADPTIQYALAPARSPAPADGYWKRVLTQQDLRSPSPFNTYLNKGLPPGPICNPGLAALEAVLYPEEGNALYFVARPDGSHAFAATFEEHMTNVARYRNQ